MSVGWSCLLVFVVCLSAKTHMRVCFCHIGGTGLDLQHTRLLTFIRTHRYTLHATTTPTTCHMHVKSRQTATHTVGPLFGGPLPHCRCGVVANCFLQNPFGLVWSLMCEMCDVCMWLQSSLHCC